jgi:hypothetical protein
MKTGKTKTRRKQTVGTLHNLTSVGRSPQSVSVEFPPGGPAVVSSSPAPISSVEPVRGIRKGPVPGTIDRYGAADRALFPEMKRLIGQGMSPTGAARELAEAGKVRGNSTDSETRRLAKRYRKENL